MTKEIIQVSYRLDKNLVKKLKFKALELDTSQTDLVEKYIKKGLENDK